MIVAFRLLGLLVYSLNSQDSRVISEVSQTNHLFKKITNENHREHLFAEITVA